MDCASFNELNLDEWTEALLAPLKGARFPLSGIFEITERCNLGCVHCYINQPASSRAVKARELTTSQVFSLLDQISDAGCLFLLLTGGEVLIRPDFLEIYAYARRKGLLVSVFTNGTLLTPRIADALAESRPQSLEITLYGASKVTYERVTQVPGSYERCMRGIELLRQRHVPFSLKSILLTHNLFELEAMKELAQGFGVKFRYDGMIWPRLDGSKQPFQYRLSIDDLAALDRNDSQRLQEWGRMFEKYQGQTLRADTVYNCGAGLHTFHIDSTGKASLCTMSRRPSYDLQQMSFQEAWERLGDLRKLKRQLDTKCRTCTIGSLCVQCPGWSQAVYGDDETPVDFLCQLAHLRNDIIDQPASND